MPLISRYSSAVALILAVQGVIPAQESNPAETAEPEPPPIAWNAWGPAVFERAREESRGILLSVVSEWCRPCQAMEERVWSDPLVRKYATSIWIPVRVDADERPDIDSRYQAALGALNRSKRGLPLTAFLFHTGEAMWADTYIPLEDSEGRPGLRELLVSMEHFRTNRFKRARENALRVQGWFESLTRSRPPEELRSSLQSAVIGGIIGSTDHENGGFGRPPRLTNLQAAELILDASIRRGDEGLKEHAFNALRAPVRGAVFDHLDGGFHMPPPSEEWEVPVFGKRLDVNGLYLRAMAEALRVRDDEELARAAGLTIDYILGTLQAPDGGFYQWQAPSSNPTDEAAYYTWRVDELKKSLDEKEWEWARLLYGLNDSGDLLLGLPPRYALKVVASPEAAAKGPGLDAGEAVAAAASIRAKMKKLRDGKAAPPVRQVRTAGDNALAISGLLHAGALLEREDATEAALRALDWILGKSGPLDKGIGHRLDMPGGGENPARMMRDLAFLGHALLDAHELTGEGRYFAAATQVVTGLRSQYGDDPEGGFFDFPSQPEAPGYLRFRMKNVPDTLEPSPNAEAARFLCRMSAHMGEESLRVAAGRTLGFISSRLTGYDATSSSFAQALGQYLEGTAVITVHEAAGDDGGLAAAAWRLDEPYKAVVRGRPGADRAPFAKVCLGTSCSEPLRSAREMAGAVTAVRTAAGRGGDSVAGD